MPITKKGSRPWVICLSASLFFFYEFFQINMLNSIAPGITRSFSPTAFGITLRAAISNLQNWLAGLYTCLLSLPILVLGALWGNLYLTQMRGLNQLDASYVIMVLYIGMIIGSPLIGWFSDWIKHRRMPMFIGGVAYLSLLLFLIYFPQINKDYLIVLFFGLGFLSRAPHWERIYFIPPPPRLFA
jgi:MFS family permease